jgi:flagellar hook assembly protein FlgD
VRTLHAGALSAGEHRVDWDGRDGGGAPAAAGLYFARVEAAGGAVTRRLAVIH